jgi:8-oxo-dGTP pyrophosphatase MutT (NUDIX family)
VIDPIEDLKELLRDFQPDDDEEASDLKLILSLLSNPKSEIRNPKSQIVSLLSNPKSEIPNPKSQIVSLLSNPKSEIRNPKSLSPLARSHFDPGHVTASAFIVHPASGRLLLHHHRRLNKWLQMGGHLDPGERVVDAALREAREESGLPDLRLLDERPFDVDIHPIPAGKGEPPHSHFDVRFVLVTDHPEATERQESESLELAWFPFAEAAERMNEPESRRAVAKIERMLKGRSS